MSVTETIGKRCPGRPQTRPDGETRHLIAEAARSEFLANGYGGTCMDNVAKRAGVSKKTLYRLVPTKADLFRTSVSDRIDRFMLAIDLDGIGALDVAAGLERILTEFGTLTLSDETIAIQKLVIAESDRFPELATSFYADAIFTTYAVLEDYLRLHCARGSLDLDDPHLAAGLLRGMMIMEPQRAVMLRQRAAPAAAEIAARARACVHVFLCGCLKDQASVRIADARHTTFGVNTPLEDTNPNAEHE